MPPVPPCPAVAVPLAPPVRLPPAPLEVPPEFAPPVPPTLVLPSPSSAEQAETSRAAAKPSTAKFRSNPNDRTRRLFMQTLLTDGGEKIGAARSQGLRPHAPDLPHSAFDLRICQSQWHRLPGNGNAAVWATRPVWCQKIAHISHRCSIYADLGYDPVAHRLETPCVPKKRRATARHALRVLCIGRSEALPLAVFSSRTCLTEIGRAAHASRRAYPSRVSAFAARASTTRRVAKLGGGLW